MNKSDNGIKYFSCGRATVYEDKCLYSDSNLIDTGQTCCSSGFAVSGGALVTGMVKDNAKESMIDTKTWNLQESNDITNWKTINPNYTIDNYKTKSVTSVCHNNNYYVIAQRGLEEKLIFEYLNLDKIGMSSQNVTENAKKSDSNVNPNNNENSDNNLLECEFIDAAKTGDYLLLLIISLLIGISLASLILYNQKQNK